VRFKVGVSRPSASPEHAIGALHGKSVLIVDDNHTNRRILTAMLARWGLRPLEADSGKAALTALDRANDAGQTVSIVVTDLRMPEIDGFALTRAIRDHPRFGSLPVILLSSSASTGEQAICTELGIAARLHKPVKQSLLLDNIMLVLDAADRSRSRAVTRDATPESTNAGPRSLRILLAEDNAVNQKFAVRVLEGAGHTVTVANNGREAIDSTGSQEFDVVLMDVQMPEVDGLDATRAIRIRGGGRTRLPIIAMTADAMKGDREMCLEAGMDGYVSKPVKKDVLFAEVERVLKELSHGENL
jgi:CheY-like chemotaxis protein